MKPWLIFLAAGLAGAAALRAEQPAQDTIFESAGPMDMSWTDTETTIILHDQVVVTGTGTKITCDVLKIVALRQGDPSALGQFKNYKSLLATGHVVITQGDRIGTCGRAEFFPSEDKVVLSENAVVLFPGDKGGVTPSITPGPHGQIILHRGQRDVEVVPAPGEINHGVLPQIKDLGFGTAGKPATPPAPVPTK